MTDVFSGDWLQEIIKLTGIITIDRCKYQSSIHDLEHLGELGFGSCGQVVKMRHPPSQATIAVKVPQFFCFFSALILRILSILVQY